jgi:hypothetical protein
MQSATQTKGEQRRYGRYLLLKLQTRPHGWAMTLIAREARVQNTVCHETWTEAVAMVESGLLPNGALQTNKVLVCTGFIYPWS